MHGIGQWNHFDPEDSDLEDQELSDYGGNGQGVGPNGDANLEAYYQHLLTHKPVDPRHCEACMRAKTHNLSKFRGRSVRQFRLVWVK